VSVSVSVRVRVRLPTSIDLFVSPPLTLFASLQLVFLPRTFPVFNVARSARMSHFTSMFSVVHFRPFQLSDLYIIWFVVCL